ncbi:MAG: hypothetical protein HOB84_14145 [Candidatus Marinimicrobia bacterium]|jgi:hypothetical protein|nr:hypothetical protein [Candidatus Neomarinimicrobiota bacterium]MBT4362205.1 hypothetical protein [Candidatus Neomarinimicrobiota bacterium]MBT4715905.1 hypothetical protein [Candidatus Neomarinimicrobiota bacterium]MBT4947382.1 hypothetical protein [Candidatus Neomarinimicrobiota bacterium]MBT5268984.1 hypothetical protein [Candidatus Neomarinimicrobiota bacterium]
MALVRYHCAICGESIDDGSQFDPCGVSIFSNLDKETSEQLEQMFFCHYECFRNSLEPGTRMYLNFEDQE